jgi:hypothetical protein
MAQGGYDDHAFLTSKPIDVAQILPFSFKSAETNPTVDDDAQTANELCLVDHPLPFYDDTEPDIPMPSVPPDDLFYVSSSLDESGQNGEPAFSSTVNLINFLDEPVPGLSIEVGSVGPSSSESISAPADPPLLDDHGAEATAPDSDPVIPSPSVSGLNEEQPAGTSDNNQEEDLIPSNGVGQQASNEPTSDEPLSKTEDDGTTLHAVELPKFKGLPSIDTNITSLIDDLSAYLSPDDYNPNVRASSPTPLSTRPPSSHGSPTRTLFPMSERFTSERKLANYTKRFHEAIEAPASRSCDNAIPTDLEDQNLQRRIQVENSTTSDISSTFLSPLSIFSSSLLHFIGLGADRPQAD